MKTFAKWLTAFICWATISPMFYYLAAKWRLVDKFARVFALLLSPLFIMIYFLVYAILFVVVMSVVYENNYTSPYADAARLSRVTGVVMPEYEVVSDTLVGQSAFLGDYSRIMTIEFEEDLPALFYQTLDSLVVVDSEHWSRASDAYCCRWIWGNGFPAPPGENDDDDNYFTLSLPIAGSRATLEYGAW